MNTLSRAGVCLALASAAALAQSVISAHSGMIHYMDGKVLLAGQPVESKFGSFPEVKENATLQTEEGRAEVLLTPGVFLRLGENSSFRMITNRLVDTRLELLSGSAILEADELMKDNAVTVVFRNSTVQVRKHGLYRWNSDPAEFRVYDGEAEVQVDGKNIEVKEGRLLRFDGELAVEKFDKNIGDSLSRWSKHRAEYVAMANVSAAKSLRDSGTSWAYSGWRWNPYFGMFTFVPMHSTIWSPYGFRFWSPGAVFRVYAPRPVYTGPAMSGYNAALGYNTVGHTSSGYSGTIAASAPSMHAPTTAASGAASAPVSRGGGSAGGQHR